MKIYEELVKRGLVAQVTNEAEVRELVDNGRAVFYEASLLCVGRKAIR